MRRALLLSLGSGQGRDPASLQTPWQTKPTVAPPHSSMLMMEISTLRGLAKPCRVAPLPGSSKYRVRQRFKDLNLSGQTSYLEGSSLSPKEQQARVPSEVPSRRWRIYHSQSWVGLSSTVQFCIRCGRVGRGSGLTGEGSKDVPSEVSCST